MANLLDFTPSDRRTDRRRDTDLARIIFMTAARQDYCRENAPPDIATYAAAVDYAARIFRNTADATARRAVAGFRVEFW